MGEGSAKRAVVEDMLEAEDEDRRRASMVEEEDSQSKAGSTAAVKVEEGRRGMSAEDWGGKGGETGPYEGKRIGKFGGVAWRRGSAPSPASVGRVSNGDWCVLTLASNQTAHPPRPIAKTQRVAATLSAMMFVIPAV